MKQNRIRSKVKKKSSEATDDINDIQPVGLTSAGYIWPTVAGGGPRLFTNPNIQGQVSANTWTADSNYNGLNVEAIKRLSHGLQFQGSYTFAKSIDTSSSGIADDTFGNSVSSLQFFNLAASLRCPAACLLRRS